MKLMVLDGNSIINRAFYGVKILTTKDGTYISGGNLAAPMAGELIANILDYLGYQKSGNTVNENGVTIPNVVGQTPDEARAALNALGLNVRTSGEGSVVTDQLPTAGLASGWGVGWPQVLPAAAGAAAGAAAASP